MPRFDPTRPRPDRLARLGVVLDAGDRDRATRLARLCDRAGIEAVWLVDRASLDGSITSEDGTWRVLDPNAEVVASVRSVVDRARLGAFAGRPANGCSGEEARALDELTLDAAAAAAAASTAAPRHQAARNASTVRRGALLTDLRSMPDLLGAVDDVVLAAWAFDDLEAAADEVRAEAAEAGREPGSLGVGVLIATSIGRTQAEARARADADPSLTAFGPVEVRGIFGTLEECQDRVIALAHAGVTDLRCILPDSVDVHDAIAQLTAVTIGTTDVLRPGSLRSLAPPPPEGWGGRAPAGLGGVSPGSRRD